ncbi:16S rRNA (uracil(1498)-N(3))-methyltransferase [soil metagenome]
MRLHRFYISPDDCELNHSFWTQSKELRNQWLNVLRYRAGDEVVLFDGVSMERLYKLVRIEPDAVQLEMVTEFERKLPSKHIYLFWSLLKKDKNDWVIQKCTELGISNFVPVIAERSEKTGFNLERALKIAIEAAEQCGRSDIPHMREPLSLQEAINEYKDKVNLLICDEAASNIKYEISNIHNPCGVMIGPEGGWTEAELNLFKQENLDSLHLGNLTLRAETAAVAAAAKLIQ